MQWWIRGARGAHPPPPPPPGAQILSISCSFRENLAKSYVGAPPPPGSWRPPPRDNPGSAAGVNEPLRFICTDEANTTAIIFLLSLSLLNVNIKLDSL